MVDNKIVFKNKEADVETSVLGISGENEQQRLIFCFEDGFVDGACSLELELPDGKKGAIEKLEKENETYSVVVKNSLLKRTGEVKMQLKIIQKTAVWKSTIFKMTVIEAIKASETIEEDYPNWVEDMTIRMSELEEGVSQIAKDVANLENYDDTEVRNEIEQVKKEMEGSLKEETDPTVPAHVKQITEENIESWNNKSDFSGDYEDLENKPKIPDVSKFIDNTVNNLINYDTKKQVDEKIAKIRTMKLERVEVLPTENINTDTIYLLPKSNANNNNIYDQFVFFNDDWEKWGDTEIDLSNYATIEALNEALSNIDLANYATKEEIENLASKLYVDEKIGDIDTLLSSIADESEAI